MRYADTTDLAWANGSGTTRMMWSDAQDERRISIATLRQPGAFSSLPQMLRTLVVLDPLMVSLEIDNRPMKLRRGDIVSFLSTQRVTLLALDRPGRVLNVMGRIDSWEPHVSSNPESEEITGWVAADAIVWKGNALDRGDLVMGTTPPTGMLAIAFRPIISPTAF